MTKEQALSEANKRWQSAPLTHGSHIGRRYGYAILAQQKTDGRFRVGYFEYTDDAGLQCITVEVGRSSISWEDAFEQAKNQGDP